MQRTTIIAAGLGIAFASIWTLAAAAQPAPASAAQSAADELIGTIVFSAGSAKPNGWLPCNGLAYLRSDYPKLFAIIDTKYGVGDPANATFRVPDLQGRAAYGLPGKLAPTEMAGDVGTKIGSLTDTEPFQTGGANSSSNSHGKVAGDLEAPDPFNYTEGGHTHSGTVTVKTVSPGMLLSCFIKAK